MLYRVSTACRSRHYVCCFAPNSILCTGLRNRGEKNWSHCCSNIGSRTPVISTPTFCSGDRDGYSRGMYEFFHAWKICQVILPSYSAPSLQIGGENTLYHLMFFFRYQRQRVKTNSLSSEGSNCDKVQTRIANTFLFFISPFARLSRKGIRSRASLNHIRVLLLYTAEFYSIRFG